MLQHFENELLKEQVDRRTEYCEMFAGQWCGVMHAELQKSFEPCARLRTLDLEERSGGEDRERKWTAERRRKGLDAMVSESEDKRTAYRIQVLIAFPYNGRILSQVPQVRFIQLPKDKQFMQGWLAQNTTTILRSVSIKASRQCSSSRPVKNEDERRKAYRIQAFIAVPYSWRAPKYLKSDPYSSQETINPCKVDTRSEPQLRFSGPSQS